MTRKDETAMGGAGRSFPSTHWWLIDSVRDPDGERRDAALQRLVELYWKPVYCWLRRNDYSDADAKDLVQEFFLVGLEEGKFGKADPSRGRFRTFLLACLKNFVSNFERDRKARRRHPSHPVISIDMMDADGVCLGLAAKDTPENSFDRAWMEGLLLHVAKSIEEECQKTGKQSHYELFRRRIIEPILQGDVEPPIGQLAKEMGLTEKEEVVPLLVEGAVATPG